MPAISLMSAPAAKTFSPPYTMTARTLSSAESAAAADRNPSWISMLSAFIGGRFSRMVPILSATEVCTSIPSGYVTHLVPQGEQRHRHELEVGDPERDPDDRDELGQRGGDVAQRQPPAGHDEPDHVADRGHRAGRGLADQFPTEGPERVVGDPERGHPER